MCSKRDEEKNRLKKSVSSNSPFYEMQYLWLWIEGQTDVSLKQRWLLVSTNKPSGRRCERRVLMTLAQKNDTCIQKTIFFLFITFSHIRLHYIYQFSLFFIFLSQTVNSMKIKLLFFPSLYLQHPLDCMRHNKCAF